LHAACEWSTHLPARQAEFWRARPARVALRTIPVPAPPGGAARETDLLVELTVASEPGAQVRVERLRLDGWDSAVRPPEVRTPAAVARAQLAAERRADAGTASLSRRPSPGAPGAAIDAVVAIATLPVLVLGAALGDLAGDASPPEPPPTLDQLRAASDPVEFAAWQREREVASLVADQPCTPTTTTPCVFRLRLGRAPAGDAAIASLALGLTVEHPDSYANWPAACDALGRTFALPPLRVGDLEQAPRQVTLSP
jgi:hypothetical protein